MHLIVFGDPRSLDYIHFALSSGKEIAISYFDTQVEFCFMKRCEQFLPSLRCQTQKSVINCCVVLLFFNGYFCLSAGAWEENM